MNDSPGKSVPGTTKQLFRFLLTIFLLGTNPVTGFGAVGGTALSSPQGGIKVLIQMPPAGTLERPRWSATFEGKSMLIDCGLGLETTEAGDLMAGVSIVHQSTRSYNER